MVFPAACSTTSPLRGATQATGMVISPEPWYSVAGYGSRDCAPAGAARPPTARPVAANTMNLLTTLWRNVRMHPPGGLLWSVRIAPPMRRAFLAADRRRRTDASERRDAELSAQSKSYAPLHANESLTHGGEIGHRHRLATNRRRRVSSLATLERARPKCPRSTQRRAGTAPARITPSRESWRRTAAYAARGRSVATSRARRAAAL